MTSASTARQTARMSVAFSGLTAQWLRGLTINAHERLAIAHLWEHGPMTMSELGARIPLSRAAVTALTDRLEALTYVQRTPDLLDRRRTVLSLTERPVSLIAELSRHFEQTVSAIEEDFNAEELSAIARYIERVHAASHHQAEVLRSRSDEELPTAEV